MEITNLTHDNVAELTKKLDEMREENPDIKHHVFDMGEIKETLEKGKTENGMLEDILDKVKGVDRKLDMIFGGHVLIDGQFKDSNRFSNE